jgi:hypothetical protein
MFSNNRHSFLSRLCNGHNDRARHFLREQDRSANSADIGKSLLIYM